MDFLRPALSIEPIEISNSDELSFESDNGNLQLDIVLESDEEFTASSTILTGLETVLYMWGVGVRFASSKQI